MLMRAHELAMPLGTIGGSKKAVIQHFIGKRENIKYSPSCLIDLYLMRQYNLLSLSAEKVR